MNNLEDFTLKQVSEFIIHNIASDREISTKLARKLFINALSYNSVIESINEQIDFLTEEARGGQEDGTTCLQ